MKKKQQQTCKLATKRSVNLFIFYAMSKSHIHVVEKEKKIKKEAIQNAMTFSMAQRIIYSVNCAVVFIFVVVVDIIVVVDVCCYCCIKVLTISIQW